MRKLLAAAGVACIIVAIILLKWGLLAPEPRQGGPQAPGAAAKAEPPPPIAAPEPESARETVQTSKPAQPADPRLYEESVFVEDWWLPAYEELAKADADFVRDVTGFAIGGIPPVGHTTPIRTYIDQDLLRYLHIWAAAGTPRSVFELTPAQLVQLTGAPVISVT